MFVETVSPEKLAMLVHHYREALAKDFGCEPGPRPEWEDLSRQEHTRLVAATRLALLDLRHTPLRRTPDRPSVPESPGGSEGKECGC